MSLCALTSFDKHCPAAAAGLRSVKLYLPEDVALLPVWANGVYSATDPTLVDGKSAYSLPIDNFSGSIGIQPANGGGGDYWQHTVRVRFRRNRQEVGAWRRLLQNRKVHLETEDFYGVRMWFPDMRLASELEHGEQLSAPNRFTFTFRRSWHHPGVYLAEVVSASNFPTVWGDVDANEGWGDGTNFWGFPS